MAGQPQDPSWQPGGQDQAREAWQPNPQDQAREAWPQPSFTPPTGSPPDTFVFAQPPVYGQPGQPGQGQDQPGQGQPGQGQPGQGQPGQGQPGQGHPGQGYPPPTYTAYEQAQSAPPQWQANQGMPRTAAPRPRGEKGFVGSLFDFSFNSMVTPKIIKVIYMLITAWVGLWALILLITFFKYYGTAAGFFALIVIDPIMVLLGLGFCRMVLEFYMITFKIHEDVKAIRAKGEEQG